LIRPDGSQAPNGHLGNVTDTTFERAAVLGVQVAKQVLKDEADRLALPRPVFGAPGSYQASIG